MVRCPAFTAYRTRPVPHKTKRAVPVFKRLSCRSVYLAVPDSVGLQVDSWGSGYDRPEKRDNKRIFEGVFSYSRENTTVSCPKGRVKVLSVKAQQGVSIGQVASTHGPFGSNLGADEALCKVKEMWNLTGSNPEDEERQSLSHYVNESQN